MLYREVKNDTIALMTYSFLCMKDYDDLIQFWIRDSIVFKETVSQKYPEPFERSKFWLMLASHEVVGYIETLRYLNRSEFQLILCSIEVRDEYRGIGLSRELVNIVEEIENLTLYTTGSFTPEGKKALSFLPLAPGGVGYGFKSMTFVKSWPLLITKH